MQGFSQVSRVDYFDTYAPVAKLASIRMVLTLATCLNLELHQIDIKGAYLNGELNNNKYIYMHQPPGYADLALPCHVCCLHKTLYGLKQSGHHWYQKLVEILVKNLGFKLWEVDQAMFVKLIKKTLTIIIEHVDDCTITTSSLSLIVKLKVQIRKHVKITNLGKLHWFISKLISYCSDWTALDNVPLSQGPQQGTQLAGIVQVHPSSIPNWAASCFRQPQYIYADCNSSVASVLQLGLDRTQKENRITSSCQHVHIVEPSTWQIQEQQWQGGN